MTPRAVSARDAGLALISRINRWMIAAAIGFSGLVSVVAANAFHGRTVGSSASSGASSSGAASSSNSAGSQSQGGGASQSSSGSSGGDGLQQPAQAPAPAPAGPASVVSGGS